MVGLFTTSDFLKYLLLAPKEKCYPDSTTCFPQQLNSHIPSHQSIDNVLHPLPSVVTTPTPSPSPSPSPTPLPRNRTVCTEIPEPLRIHSVGHPTRVHPERQTKRLIPNGSGAIPTCHNHISCIFGCLDDAQRNKWIKRPSPPGPSLRLCRPL